MSLDGHDKLCGFQKSMFPLCIYGGQDAFSGRVNFLRVWTSNNNPKVVGRFYFEYLLESKKLPKRVRIDRGTETDVLTTIHCYLHSKYQTFPTEDEVIDGCVMYGPSTANKIERWWRELHHRMEMFFKEQLKELIDNGHYDSTANLDRLMLAFIYIPVIQKELDIFRTTIWNHSRGRKQRNKQLPTGIPQHIFEHPEEYGAEEFSTEINEDDLVDVADEMDVFDGTDDFLTPEQRQKFEEIVTDPQEISAVEAANSFRTLKTNYIP